MSDLATWRPVVGYEGRSVTCYNQGARVLGRRYERRPSVHRWSKPTMLVQSSFSFPAPEQWRPVVGYESRYQVSDQGQVRVILTRQGAPRSEPLVMKTRPDWKGYPRVQFNDKRFFRIHRLVLTAFVGPRPDGLEGAHNNGDKSDNRLTNLAWKTRQENADDAVRLGETPRGDRNGRHTHPERTARGERSGHAKLTESQVLEILAARAGGEIYRVLAARYGVSETLIKAITDRRKWAHLCW